VCEEEAELHRDARLKGRVVRCESDGWEDATEAEWLAKAEEGRGVTEADLA